MRCIALPAAGATGSRDAEVSLSYDQRSAVERVNSRLAGGFGFERAGIRGLAKMRLRVTMALTIMLAMALGRIRAGQPEHLRSLVKPA